MASRDDHDPVDWWTQNAPTPGYTPGPTLTAAQSGTAGQGFESTWDPGGTAPTNAPPGYHWDAQFAMFVPDAAPVNPNAIAGPGGGDPGGVSAGAPAPMGVPTSGFGAAPAPYASNPNAPQYQPMPAYVAPTWQGGDFQNPTAEDLYNSPGYQARLDRRLQAQSRQQAAQGTVLNGGSLKALDRSAQDYATNEYQTLRSNSYDNYVQKYRQFTDAAGMDLGARTVNANENQNSFLNRTNTFNTGNVRSLSDYITNVTNSRNAELDYWNRLQDVNQTGAQLAGGSR